VLREQTALFEQSRETTASWILASQGEGRQESTTRIPTLTEDISPLINRAAAQVSPPPTIDDDATPQPEVHSPRNESLLQPAPQRVQSPRVFSPPPVLINPLDRPSSPTLNPFNDPSEFLSIRSSLSSHTLTMASPHLPAQDDAVSTISDWTDAFESASEAQSPYNSDSDVVSDAESEASWARVSRTAGVH
jgi:hypothetical protein